jgi:hypothetical protein
MTRNKQLGGVLVVILTGFLALLLFGFSTNSVDGDRQVKELGKSIPNPIAPKPTVPSEFSGIASN